MYRFLRSDISFSRQLTMAFVSGILVLALVSSLLISWLVSQAARSHFMGVGLQVTETFATQSRLALLYASAENAATPAKAIKEFPDINGVAIFYPDGELLFQEEKAPILNSDWRNKIGRSASIVFEDANDWYFAARVISGGESEVESSPFSNEQPANELLGYVLVTVGKDTLYAMTNRIFVINSLIALALASLLLVILRIITRRLTNPLENLRAIMRRAELGETAIRTDLEGSKDIKEMERSFNKMMDVLEERESQLKEARDAALETARAKAEFAAMVSHEIRTPLNGVLGMLNLIQEIGVPERQRDYLSVAISSGDTLHALINDILDFSKIEAGKLELEAIQFNLRETLEDVSGLFAEAAQSKNIELCLDLPAELPAEVEGDALRLRQILTNLLSNALKFTESGEVLLSAQVIESDENNNSIIEFSVEDTGIGIPVKAQERIFESFHQADGTTTRRFGGTGLGLAICKQLISLLGGVLRLESAPGLGSRFHFAIPLSVLKAQVKTSFLGKVRILCLDRQEHNRRYIESCLQIMGCHNQVRLANIESLDSYFIAHRDSFDISLVSDNVLKPSSALTLRLLREKYESVLGHIVIMRLPSPDLSSYVLSEVLLNRPVRLSQLGVCFKRLLSSGLLTEERKALPSLPIEGHSSPHNHIRILIVDDNRTNQLVAKAMLAESGYQTDVASNGREAVELVCKGHYDLVLMDCNMPVMDGYEATRQIRALKDERSSIKIFAMTAVDNQEDVKRCYDVGMSDFLLKPLNLDSLRFKVDALLASRSTKTNLSELQQGFVDDDSLTNLENAMGAKVSEIIEAFLTDTPVYLKDLRIALDESDWVSMSSVAHSLKGSARNLGANIFASACREVEEILGQEKIERDMVDRMIRGLEQDYANVQVELQHRLGHWQESTNHSEHTVLIVDDDRSTRLTIAHCLESDGLHLIHAANGQIAIDKFLEQEPDLIIMDAVMPVMDGFQASTEIKRLPTGRSTPILMITALENDTSVEKAFQCGAADFIPKPINLAVLRQRVRRVLDARQSEQKVKDLAYNDSLTGLPNRIAFSDRLHQDLAYARRNNNQLAVMFIDVDHFKDVNDNLGHAAGDELLKILSKRVLACIRGEDTLARLGGDEFVVVLSDLHRPEGADIAAQNILNALSSPFEILDQEIFIGASIGIAIFPDDGDDRETLVKNADTAMYRAKAQGRNNYQFYRQEMSISISERVALERDLRKVVEHDELVLHLQPKVNAATDALLGAEALVRWNHPERGILYPDSFISIAEGAGIIDKIGSWVMRSACEQFQRWHKQSGYGGKIAVNVSPRQFMETGFVDEVRDCLELTNLDPSRLELELTESAILEQAEPTIKKLRTLRDMGVRIAIDDFGVGYSSFNYLKQLPVDVLKIDKSFIHDIPEDVSGTAIIDGIIRLAHNLNLEVVAEGVETKAQYHFLKQHNCDTIQGNYISRPVIASEFHDKYISAKLAEGI